MTTPYYLKHKKNPRSSISVTKQNTTCASEREGKAVREKNQNGIPRQILDLLQYRPK